MTTVSRLPFNDRLQDEGRELVTQALDADISVRLMGGMAIRLLLGDSYPPTLERSYGDLDLIVSRRDARELEQLLISRGWASAVEFNALNGARRMLFQDPASDAQIDVFVEAFEMCHKLPLADSLRGPRQITLPAADLLMSKLQIVRLNAKDRNDSYALLIGCDGASDGARQLDPGRISAITRGDWGIHHTFELNLAVLDRHVDTVGLDAGQQAAVQRGIGVIQSAMESASKTSGWKLRARVGERRRWFEEPEEVDRDGPQ